MKTIKLPNGTEHVRFDELAHLIALAMWPLIEDGSPGDGLNYGFALVTIERELAQAAQANTILLKDPVSKGPYDNQGWTRLDDALIRVDDLRKYLAERGIGVEVVAPAQTHATPAPVANTKPDVTLMATRQQLINAFGSFTGMNASWFSNIKDTPTLLAARKVTGQGGRGHIAEPLFCPFEVLQWLIAPARRKGRKLGQDKGWELFESYFPRAYAAFSVGDTRTD